MVHRGTERVKRPRVLWAAQIRANVVTGARTFDTDYAVLAGNSDINCVSDGTTGVTISGA